MEPMRMMEVQLDSVDEVILNVLTSIEEAPNAQTLYEACEKVTKEQGRTLSRVWFNKHIGELTDEGVLTYEDVGTERFYSLVKNVDIREGIARVPAPITEDIGMKLRDTLTMFNIRGKLHGNICKMFNENPQYQSPDGLNWLLNAFKIEPNTARIIAQHVFSAYQAQFATRGLGLMAPYQGPMPGLSGLPGQSMQPAQAMPQVVQSPGGPQIMTLPIQTPGGASTPLVIVSPPAPTPQQPAGAVEHRVTERLAERTIYKYKVDEAGNPVLDDSGQPVVVEVVKEPIVIGGQPTGQQITPKDLLDVATRIVEISKPKEGETAKPVDEEKIILKTKDVIKGEFKDEIDTLKSYIGGTNASVEKLATTINQYFAVRSAVEPYEKRIRELTEGKGLSENQFRMQTQERLIKYVAEKMDTIPATIRQFMGQQYVQTLAVLEQSYGMEPGTLIIPYIRQMAGTRPGEATAPETPIPERRKIVEKLRTKVEAPEVKAA